jgi:hypothetical protein
VYLGPISHSNNELLDFDLTLRHCDLGSRRATSTQTFWASTITFALYSTMLLNFSILVSHFQCWTTPLYIQNGSLCLCLLMIFSFLHLEVHLMKHRRYRMSCFPSAALSSKFQETLGGSCLCDCLTKRLRQVGYVDNVNSCVGCLT